jgi:alcohol dehydrogenase class IV
LNIPHTLKEIDINTDNAQEIGEMAYKDPSTPSNAKPVNGMDLEQLFRAAVIGDLNGL